MSWLNMDALGDEVREAAERGAGDGLRDLLEDVLARVDRGELQFTMPPVHEQGSDSRALRRLPITVHADVIQKAARVRLNRPQDETGGGWRDIDVVVNGVVLRALAVDATDARRRELDGLFHREVLANLGEPLKASGPIRLGAIVVAAGGPRRSSVISATLGRVLGRGLLRASGRWSARRRRSGPAQTPVDGS